MAWNGDLSLRVSYIITVTVGSTSELHILNDDTILVELDGYPSID